MVVAARASCSACLCRRRNPLRSARDRWYVPLGVLLVLLAAGGFLQSFVRRDVLQAYDNPSPSMMSTLLPGDRVLVNKRAYRTEDPQLLDVALFENPEDPSKVFLKRIVGLPGDTIEVRDDLVWRNGSLLEEPYAELRYRSADAPAPLPDLPPVEIPAGHYYLIGDNRGRSFDSRVFGPVSREAILGRVAIIYWSQFPGEGVRWSRIGTIVR